MKWGKFEEAKIEALFFLNVIETLFGSDMSDRVLPKFGQEICDKEDFAVTIFEVILLFLDYVDAYVKSKTTTKNDFNFPWSKKYVRVWGNFILLDWTINNSKYLILILL